MAADWVRLSFLGPAAGMQLPMVRTHTNGSALASIMDVIPDFLPLCKFINSNRLDNKTIDPTSHFSLALSRQYEAPSGLPVPVFWDFVARFLLPFQVPRIVLSGRIVYSGTKKGYLRAYSSAHGLWVATALSCQAGKVIRGL